MALGLVDMRDHELAHALDVAAPRRRQQALVRGHVGLAELLVGPGARPVVHGHAVAQQMIDHLAHEAQQHVGIGGGQHVVEVQVLLALHQRLFLACRLRRTGGDAAFQRREMLLRQVRHGAGRQLGLEQAAHGIDLRHVHFAEEKIVLQELEGALERHLADRGAARRAGRHGDQPLHFQRLQGLARRALAHPEQGLQLVFLGQLVARPSRRSAIQRLISSTTRSPRLGERRGVGRGPAASVIHPIYYNK